MTNSTKKFTNFQITIQLKENSKKKNQKQNQKKNLNGRCLIGCGVIGRDGSVIVYVGVIIGGGVFWVNISI